MRSAPPSHRRHFASSDDKPVQSSGNFSAPATSVKEEETVPESKITVHLVRVRFFGMRPTCPALGHFYNAAEAVARGELRLAEAHLHDYYSKCHPWSAADVTAVSVLHELAMYPPLAAVLPWWQVTPEQALSAAEAQVIHGLDRDGLLWGITDGCSQFGPVSKRRIIHEVGLIQAAVNGIREDNRRNLRDTGDPGTVLSNFSMLIDDQWGEEIAPFCVMIGGIEDARKVAAMAAIGYSDVSIVVGPTTPTVRRSEASTWHHVQTGLFTEEEAVAVFDAYMSGKDV